MRKLNIAILTILLVFQTILGPIGSYNTAFANEPDPSVPASTETDTENGNAIDEIVTEEPVSEEEVSEENPTDEPTPGDETSEENPTDEPTPGDETSKENPTDEPTPGDETSEENPTDESTPGDETSEENPTKEPTAGEGETEKPGFAVPLSLSDMQSDVELSFVNLITGGSTITNAQEAEGIEPMLGQEVELNYAFAIEATQKYDVGSSFSFELPNALLNFNQGGLNGKVILEDGDIEFDYATVENTVTVTLTNGTIEDGNNLDGQLRFSALFSETGAQEGFGQELVIPVIGKDSVTLPFTFKPQIDGNKQPLTKSGTARITDGERFIDWTVWVNEDGHLLNNAIIEEALGEGHELSGDVTIERYPFNLTGQSSVADYTGKVDSLSEIKLDNGYYSYKLTYTTKVTRAATKEREEFRNAVTFYNNGSTVASKNIPVNHVYGTKLAKRGLGTDKYGVKWEIKYNFFGSKFDSNTITDKVTGPHIIKADTVKVYSVTVDTAGNGTKGALVSPQPSPTLSADEKTLDISLASPNGEAYIIEYETELNDEFYTGQDRTRVENTVSYDGVSAKDGFNISENIFHKTLASIDYDKKEITWTLTINAEKAMKDVVITDTFAKIDGKTRQTLIEDSFTGGVSPDDIQKDDDGYTDSFKLILGNLPEGKKTITYKTKFAIDANGATYGIYKNTAELGWESTNPANTNSYALTKQAQYDPGTSPTGRNGYKEGSFDHVEQKFNWKLAVNINKQEINGAVLTDMIEEGHKLVPNTVKVYKLNLTTGEKGQKGEELATGRTIVENEKGFIVTFTESTQDAYIVEYQTEDEDDIIGHKNAGYYGNSAKFVTAGHSGKEFLFDAKATVQHANKLISKGLPAQNVNEETITWTVKLNESHSSLGDSITLSDKMSSNQMILKDKFEVREIKMDAAGAHSYGDWTSVIPTFNDVENSFTLDFDLNQKGWEVRYKTFFTGGPEDVFSNEASITYAGANDEAKNNAKQENIKFNFNDSEGSISAKKGNLKIQKVGYNPVTGERKNLGEVEFILYNRAGTVELQRGTTNENGIVEFNTVRYGYYKLVESTLLDGYKPIDSQEIRISDTTNFNENGGKYFEVINEADGPAASCSVFEIEVKDIDGNLITEGSITLKNTKTDAETTHTVGSSGKVTLPESFPAGEYKVTHATEGELNNVSVKYDRDCKDTVQPFPSCEQFTLVIKDANGDNRTDISKITLKQNNSAVAETTVNTNGQFIFDSNVKDSENGLKPGTYDVYDDKQFLGTVEISYKEICGTELEINYAPKCPIFTLTVKDADGKPVSGKTVIVKSEDGSKTIPVTGPTDSAGNVTLNDLEPGKYIVYDPDGITKIGKFTTTTDCKAQVQPNPSCPLFVLIVKDEDGNLSEGTVVILTNSTDSAKAFEATVGENGKVQLPNTTSSEKYKVTIKETNKELGEFTLSYTSNCEATVELPKSCSIFIITVKNPDGTPKQNAEVIVEDSSGNAVALTASTTDAEGEIQLPKDQAPGVYSVYEVNSNGEKADKIGDVKVTYTSDCKADVIKNACTKYTLTINNSDAQPVGADVRIVMKKTDGTVVASSVTNAAGQIEYSKVEGTLQQGETYKVFNGAGVELGTITISYINEICGAVVEVPTNSCPIFTLTVQDLYGIKRPNITVMIKDANENTIATGTTDTDGKVTIPYTVEPGTYKVYEGTTLLGTITTITCEAVFKPVYPVTPAPGGGDNTPPINPGEPGNPGTPPTNPGEPENPGTPPTNPGEPGNPSTPPTNPGEPENPGTSPANPSKPIFPGTLPVNPGELENVSAPPTNIDTPITNIGKRTDQDKTKIASTAKLPQTNGNFSTATTLFGLTLLAAAALLIVRRKKAIK